MSFYAHDEHMESVQVENYDENSGWIYLSLS